MILVPAVAGLSALQATAWLEPFLDNDAERMPPRIEEPRRGWRVALTINL